MLELWGFFCLLAYFGQFFKTYPQVDPKTGQPYPKPGYNPPAPKPAKRLENRLWAFLQRNGYFKDKAAPWVKK